MILNIIALIAFCFCAISIPMCLKEKKWPGAILWAVVAFLIVRLTRSDVGVTIIGFFVGMLAYLLYFGAKNKEAQGHPIDAKIQKVFSGLCSLIALVGLWGAFVGQHTQNGNASSNDYQVIGQKLNKSLVDNHDDMYYTSKDDDDLRYFTNDDGKVTAAKYIFGADHYSTESVMNRLEDPILHDNNLKYTTDKDSRKDFSPDGESFNVYSPKTKKWFHVKMQKDDNDKVSSFSVWPGQDDDVDDY